MFFSSQLSVISDRQDNIRNQISEICYQMLKSISVQFTQLWERTVCVRGVQVKQHAKHTIVPYECSQNYMYIMYASVNYAVYTYETEKKQCIVSG